MEQKNNHILGYNFVNNSQSNAGIGYTYMLDGLQTSEKYKTTEDSIDNENYNSMYCINSKNNNYYWYLASASAEDTYSLCTVNKSDGYLSSSSTENFGICPIVCITSEIQLETD